MYLVCIEPSELAFRSILWRQFSVMSQQSHMTESQREVGVVTFDTGGRVAEGLSARGDRDLRGGVEARDVLGHSRDRVNRRDGIGLAELVSLVKMGVAPLSDIRK
jgi:hypothetical protein